MNLFQFLVERSKKSVYQPTDQVYVMDDESASKINTKNIRVADVTSEYEGVKTTRTCLLIEGNAIPCDYPTRVMMAGLDLAKIVVVPSTIKITVWAPNADFKAKGWKDSTRASFDWDVAV